MITGTTSENDLLIGLTKKEVERLKAGDAVRFDLSQHFPELDSQCYIVYGETDEALIYSLPVTKETNVGEGK